MALLIGTFRNKSDLRGERFRGLLPENIYNLTQRKYKCKAFFGVNDFNKQQVILPLFYLLGDRIRSQSTNSKCTRSLSHLNLLNVENITVGLYDENYKKA